MPLHLSHFAFIIYSHVLTTTPSEPQTAPKQIAAELSIARHFFLAIYRESIK